MVEKCKDCGERHPEKICPEKRAISKSVSVACYAYNLIKEESATGVQSLHKFASEEQLKEHLEAMWKYTDYRLVSISKM